MVVTWLTWHRHWDPRRRHRVPTTAYVDPTSGTKVDRTFSDCLREYEAPGAVKNWPWVI